MTSSKPDFAQVCLFVISTFGVVGVPRVPMIDLVSSAALVERHCVTEITDGRVGIRERERVRYHADGADSIPAERVVFKTFDGKELRRYHAPRKSTLTSTEKAFLKCLLCCHPNSSSRVYILYANGTCWWFPGGSRPTCEVVERSWSSYVHGQTLWIMPAKARAVYAPREKPKMHILSIARSDDGLNHPFIDDRVLDGPTILH